MFVVLHTVLLVPKEHIRVVDQHQHALGGMENEGGGEVKPNSAVYLMKTGIPQDVLQLSEVLSLGLNKSESPLFRLIIFQLEEFHRGFNASTELLDQLE